MAELLERERGGEEGKNFFPSEKRDTFTGRIREYAKRKKKGSFERGLPIFLFKGAGSRLGGKKKGSWRIRTWGRLKGPERVCLPSLEEGKEVVLVKRTVGLTVGGGGR